MKPVDVKTEMIISAPVEKVSIYASDPDHAPEWYVNIRSARWETPKPLAVGSRITFEAKFLGRSLRYTYEVTEYVPGQKLVMRTAQGPFPMETTYTWKDTEEGKTHMTLRNTGRPSGFFGIFAPMMASAMKKANRKDLQRLKEIMEKKNNS